jgi:ketosteroid isomerase-like protein
MFKMKKIFSLFVIILISFGCSNDAEKKTEEKPADAVVAAAPSVAVDLPFKATYSSNFTQEVSDADLKTVMDSYVHWRSGDIDKLVALMGDTSTIEGADGMIRKLSNSDLKAYWKLHRDSIASIDIEMEAWQKMHSDKGDDIVVTWYIERDKYKTGKVDSAYYHDINIVKNGKIVMYSTYRKPKTQ